jgi:hypothetical protein
MTMTSKKNNPSGRSAKGAAPRKGSGKNSDRPQKRRLPKWCVVVLAVLAGLAVLAVILTALTFSSHRALPLTKLEDRHYLLVGRITGQLTREASRRQPRAEAQLRLTPDEVNTLLEFVRNSAKFGGSDVPPPESFDLRYQPDGTFVFVAPVDAAPRWCFGGKIYLNGKVNFEMQDEQVIVDIPELRFGRVGMKVPGGNTYFSSASTEAVRNAMSPEFKAAVKSFYTERDGTLVIVYRPKELRGLLKQLPL